MNTPDINARLFADAYIRDQDDKTIQFKARVFNIDYAAQEADIGLYPRRWGQFSELHLPDNYRVRVPLSELSLEPFTGAEQRGFEDHLIASGEQPPAWLDNAGRTHSPGCLEPVVGAVTVEAPDGTPEFSLADATEKAVEAVVHEDPVSPPEAPAEPDVQAPRTKKGKRKMFTAAEVVSKIEQLEFTFTEQMRHLRAMAEELL